MKILIGTVTLFFAYLGISPFDGMSMQLYPGFLVINYPQPLCSDLRKKDAATISMSIGLAFALLLLLNSMGAAFAQIPVSPNKLDSKGERVGTWTILFDKDMKTIENPDSAAFYSVMTFKGGKIVGTSRSFFRSGKKMSEISYENGLVVGTVVGWYESGGKEFETPYKNGLPDGKETIWFPSGKKRTEVNYKQGREEGVQTEWYPGGSKKSEISYKKGVIDGKAVRWYESGALQTEMSYKAGKLHGKRIDWLENGEIKSETRYENGKKL